VEWIPGFYGPQRFGVERPNTHYLGLLFVEGRLGEVLREYMYRYPMEDARPPGGYESRALSSVGAGFPRPRPLAIFREALQAYIFNRALSRILRDARGYAEHWVKVRCMGMEYRVPAARLPSPRLARSRSRWAGLVKSILEEEGLDLGLLKSLKSPFRPLLYPVCGFRQRRAPGGVMLRFSLPQGGYATTLLRELFEVDWVRYSRCNPG
ncbi:MAG: tRNA pseudouridine(13) synthase TruD, partial [Desulfurococcales archaeon]|nr:tRNA pseudouridine(13) synthase TruD [Desulfurococcales archaeon]